MSSFGTKWSTFMDSVKGNTRQIQVYAVSIAPQGMAREVSAMR
jgi:hypothetical protein